MPGSIVEKRMSLPRRFITLAVSPLLLAALALIAGAGSASATAYSFNTSGSPGGYDVDYRGHGDIACSGALEASTGTVKITIPGGLVTQSPSYGDYYQIVHETLGVQYWDGASWVDDRSYPVDSGSITGGNNYSNQDAVEFASARVQVNPALVNREVRIAVTFTWYATDNGLLGNNWQVGQASYFYSGDTYVGPNAGLGYCILGG
jgi:hypothetical protein